MTLVNWANEPAKAVKVTLTLPFQPGSARLVSAGKAIPVSYERGAAVFTRNKYNVHKFVKPASVVELFDREGR